MSPEILAELQASRLDGRTENIRYRQDQLQTLHSALVKHGTEIRHALQKDTMYTDCESEVEYTMSLRSLKHHYASLDFDASRSEASSVTKGLNAPQRKVGAGLVLLHCSRRFPFFSLIAPLAAAMAAGNAILVRLEQDLRHLPSVLRMALCSLDPGTFAFTTEDMTDATFLSQAILVDQERCYADATSRLSYNLLRSPVSKRVVAIVDRTADIELAASMLTAARFGFNGQSVYAADLVLVNEFVMEPFLEAVAQNIVVYASKTDSLYGPTADIYNTLLKQIKADSAAKIVFQAKQGTAVELSSRQSPLATIEVDSPVLFIATTTSLEDAITFTGSSSTEYHHPLLATFVFAAPASAQYLSQFIDAHASFVNHIPSELLVGPAAPSVQHYGISVDHRYESSMFQICRPQHVTESSVGKIQSAVLHASISTKGSRRRSSTLNTSLQRQQLLDEATRPLPSTGQALQMRGIGFFEQGILVGLLMAATPILVALSLGGYYGGRYIYRI